MELNLDFSFSSLGITESQKEEIVNKYKNIIESYFNWGIMVGEIDELAEEIQREINRELRQIKLDNILKNELHQNNFEEGKDSLQSR